jgi:hypothetical protein
VPSCSGQGQFYFYLNGTLARGTGNITKATKKNRGSFHYPLTADTLMIAFFCDVSYIDVAVDSATFIFMVDNLLPLWRQREFLKRR